MPEPVPEVLLEVPVELVLADEVLVLVVGLVVSRVALLEVVSR